MSLARIILFPRFRPPELAKSPRRNPRWNVLAISEWSDLSGWIRPNRIIICCIKTMVYCQLRLTPKGWIAVKLPQKNFSQLNF